MDTHSNHQQPMPEQVLSPSDQMSQWPTARAARGRFYGVEDPAHKGDNLCVMSMETWVDFGTLVEKQNRVMAMQAKKISELMAMNGALVVQVNDANARLGALRDVRRAEKRHELEGDLILPGSQFFKPTPRKS